MNISNFTLTEETKMRMNKPLSTRDKGRLRNEKLQDLAKSGRLAFITTRADLAEAVGFTYDQRDKAGYQWVMKNVQKGRIKETLTGYRDDGRAEYEYQYLGENTKPKATIKKKPVAKKKPMVLVNEAVKVAEEIKPAEVVITKGDLAICIKNADKSVIAEIIKVVLG